LRNFKLYIGQTTTTLTTIITIIMAMMMMMMKMMSLSAIENYTMERGLKFLKTVTRKSAAYKVMIET